MGEDEFTELVAAEWRAMPERFQKHIQNVAVLVEDEPSPSVRAEERLGPGETLLGLYHGIPNTERGSHYGEGGTLPDTITLFRLPLLEDAEKICAPDEPFRSAVQRAIRETIWHEVGHYFGLGDEEIGVREHEKTNKFDK